MESADEALRAGAVVGLLGRLRERVWAGRLTGDGAGVQSA